MDKEQTAIQRLQLAAKMSERYYKKPLLLCYSGGKDSDVCIALAQAARIPFEAQHSHTTADAPETVRYVRQRLHDLECKSVPVTINYPVYKGVPTSMWDLIPQKSLPPTRLMRYCCSILKETAGKNRAIVTGIRAAESTSRKDRTFAEAYGRTKADAVRIDFEDAADLFESRADRKFTEHDEKFQNSCRVQGKTSFNPIIDWTDHDVWDYLADRKMRINPVYNYGLTRCGCIGCPMASKARYAEFSIWPKYKALYISTFDRMIKKRKADGKPTEWTCGEECFHWWMEDGVLPGQMDFESLEVDHD